MLEVAILSRSGNIKFSWWKLETFSFETQTSNILRTLQMYPEITENRQNILDQKIQKLQKSFRLFT